MPCARRKSSGTGWRSTPKFMAVNRAAAFSAAGVLSPGGVSDGTLTISRRNSICSGWWASIQRPMSSYGPACGAGCAFISVLLVDGCEVFDEAQEYSRAGVNVLERDRFRRVMADATLAAYEQHADIGQIEERHAIVTGSAREFAHRQSLRGNRLADLFHQPWRTGGRLSFVRGVDLQRDLATRADSLHRPLDVRYRGEPLGIARRADVDGEEHLAGNDVGRPGKRFELTHGTHQLRNAGTAPLDRKHAFSGSGKRVLAQIHRHRAGVAGNAG